MANLRATRSNWLGALSAGLVVTFFCLILLWHDPSVFWNDDYQISILPVLADVARSWSEGHLPLLSPYSWVCGNLAGEFQYGTFSIFVNAIVVLIWKFPLTFPQQAAALSITHLFVLAGGAFLLARGRQLSTSLSIFVSLVAALNGWIICWGATDWFGALAAFAWLPWAWWAMEKSLRTSTFNVQLPSELSVGRWTLGVGRLLRAAVWPAPFVYLVITGGFPYTVVMLALLIVWLSAKSLGQTRNLRVVLPMLIGVALGVGLAAPALLAMFDYVRGSAREVQEASAHWQWIVPWRALPGLILPSWTVNWADFYTRLVPHTATELSCGLVAPAAVIAVFIRHPRIFFRQAKWEIALLVLLLILAMSPTAGVFRWSFRWLPFFHLALAVVGAHALQTMSRERQTRAGFSPVPATALLSLAVLTPVMLVFGTNGSTDLMFTWLILQIAVGWLIFEYLFRSLDVRTMAAPLVTFAVLLTTYFWIPPNGGVPKFNLSRDLTNAALSSTVGSEAWNSRDLKSRPH